MAYLRLAVLSRVSHKPAKCKPFNQCWFDVGPASQTLGQHQSCSGSMSLVYWESCQSSISLHRFILWSVFFCDRVIYFTTIDTLLLPNNSDDIYVSGIIRWPTLLVHCSFRLQTTLHITLLLQYSYPKVFVMSV